MNEKKDEMTPEEGVIKLRQIVKFQTGMDPREGQTVKPVRKLTKEEIAEFFGSIDNEADGLEEKADDGSNDI